MENLAPPLEMLMDLRFGLEKGQSLRRSLEEFANSRPEDPWRLEVQLWLRLRDMGRSSTELTNRMTPVRRQCLEVINQGLMGEPIYQQLCNLEEEVFEAAKLEIEEFVSVLPMKSLIPLLFLQFPAFLALLVGPFLTAFLTHS